MSEREKKCGHTEPIHTHSHTHTHTFTHTHTHKISAAYTHLSTSTIPLVNLHYTCKSTKICNTFVNLCVHICQLLYTHTYTFVNLCTHICQLLYTQLALYVEVDLNKFTHLSTFVYTFVNFCIHIHTHLSTFVLPVKQDLSSAFAIFLGIQRTFSHQNRVISGNHLFFFQN